MVTRWSGRLLLVSETVVVPDNFSLFYKVVSHDVVRSSQGGI